MGHRRLGFIPFLILVSLALGLLLPGTASDSVRPAQAATLTVNTIADDATTCAVSGTVCLREAIGSASAGDTIQFAVTGTITLSRGVLTIGKNLMISGPGADSLAIDGNNATQVFNITSGTVTLAGLTVQHGFSGIDVSGGGIENYRGTLTVNNTTLSDNSTSYYGGGIENYRGTLTVNNSTISSNSAYYGGGGIENSGTLTVNNSTISRNSATNSYGAGAGAGIESDGTLTVSNSTISDNTGSYGGGIENPYIGTLTVNNTTISGNSGGGIDNGGTATVSNSTLSGNTTSYGGGIESDGTLTVSNSTLSGNTASGGGGGIYNSGTATVTNSTLSGNLAPYGGGGIENNVTYGSLNLGSNIVAGNTGNPGPDISGHIASSQGFNVIGSSSGNNGYVIGDQVDVNAMLNPLALNAPGTTQTMSLQIGSPAIGQGNCTLAIPVSTDQRGLSRKLACDSGAYETQNPLDSIGLFDPPHGAFDLRDANRAGPADSVFAYGMAPSSLTPIVGDWTGQGRKTVGLYDPASGIFSLRNSNTAGPADLVFQYGPGGTGLLPVVGDWSGQGHDTVGLYNPANAYVYLHPCNAATCGTADLIFTYGPPNANLRPIAGDWTHQGFTTIGLYSQANAYFYLHPCNASTCTGSDMVFQYGPGTANGGAPALPLSGRWAGQLNSTIGIYIAANAYWYLKNSNAAGNADNQFQYGPGPNAGWLPVIGHWGTPGTIAQPATTLPERYPIAPPPKDSRSDTVDGGAGLPRLTSPRQPKVAQATLGLPE